MASAYENTKTVLGEGFDMKNEIEFLKNEVMAKDCQIKELQSYIDCLRTELDEVQHKKLELSEEPIKVAEMLISATGIYTNLFGKEETYNVYDKSDLRQISEHLLVYCNHAEDE